MDYSPTVIDYGEEREELQRQVYALCEELGIDFAFEKALVFVVEIGLQSPLPPRWSSHVADDSGQVYYVDNDTQTSQWESPLLPYIKQVVDIGRLYMENPYQHVINEQVNGLWQQFRDSLCEWHGPYVSDGRQYFVNQNRGISSWEDPRVEAQYLCELQSALIQKLQSAIPPQEVDSYRRPGSAGFGGGADAEEARPQTPDFAAWQVEASPRYEEETGAVRSPRDPLNTSAPAPKMADNNSLKQLRAALANKLSNIDFKGEAEKERVKMAKTFTDGIHLVYDLLEEEREMQMLQMERRKQQLIVQERPRKPPDSPKSSRGPAPESPKGGPGSPKGFFSVVEKSPPKSGDSRKKKSDSSASTTKKGKEAVKGKSS
ncbi:unnamed protein product [Amoebophrya sp. A25]|nr:unnamed protein product [Amoebophrya sp. A25]|eukprot:GSA25T00004386001.1